MFITAIHRKRPEPNKSRSIRVLCGGDGEILNLLAPLGASRAEEFSRPFLSCGLQRLQATFHLSQQKKHCCSSAFCGGDGGMPFMYTTDPCPYFPKQLHNSSNGSHDLISFSSQKSDLL